MSASSSNNAARPPVAAVIQTASGKLQVGKGRGQVVLDVQDRYLDTHGARFDTHALIRLDQQQAEAAYEELGRAIEAMHTTGQWGCASTAQMALDLLPSRRSVHRFRRTRSTKPSTVKNRMRPATKREG